MAFKFNPLTGNFDLVGSEDVQALQELLDDLIASIGQPDGLATLDGTGKVPASQLPSYVDDVIEVADFSSLPIIGETSKIYVTLDTNKVYRWTGSIYIEVSANNENSAFLFNASSDWSLIGDEYVLSILPDNHLKGTNPQVQVYEIEGSDFSNVIVYTSISPTGVISVAVPQIPDNRFAGKLIIS